MADRIGVIANGELILVEEKAELMRKLGKKQLVLHLPTPIAEIPAALQGRGLELASGGSELVFTYDSRAERTGIRTLLNDVAAAGLRFNDLRTTQSSLEDIFVDLVHKAK